MGTLKFKVNYTELEIRAGETLVMWLQELPVTKCVQDE